MEPLLPVPALENHLNSLTSLLQTIVLVRHHDLPTLLNNLQQPIQNNNSNPQRLTIDQLTQNWKNDSQKLINDVNTLRTQLAQASEVMRYVRTSSRLDSKVDDSLREQSLSIKKAIIQKVKQQARAKSRSSLSLSSKGGSSNDRKLLASKVARQLKLRELRKRLTSSSSCFSVSSKDDKVYELKEIIPSINKFNKEDDLLSLVSPRHILLKKTMHVFVAYRTHSQDRIIERVSCFGIDEDPKALYRESSFGLFRSISRCINHTINQFLNPTIVFSSKDNFNSTQNQSNLILVCSLLSSYKDLFSSELTNLRTKTINATGEGEEPQYITRSRDPLLANTEHYKHPIFAALDARRADTNNTKIHEKLTFPRDVSNAPRLLTRDSRERFLTWRHWCISKSYLDQLLDADLHNKQRKQQSLQLDNMDLDVSSPTEFDPILDVLSRGKWMKIPEIE